MSVQAKNYLDFAGLSTYDGKIKEWANSANQAGYKTVHISSDGNTLYFYKKPSAVLGTDTADSSISLNGGDLATQLDKLDDIIPATYDSTNKVYSITGLSNNFDSADKVSLVAAINSLKTEADTNKTAIGTIGSLTTTDKTNLVAAINEVLAALNDCDLTEAPLAEVSSNVVTIHGISQSNGQVAVGVNSANDIVLEEVAYTGAASDVSTEAITDGEAEPTTLYTAGTVQGTLQSIARDLNSLESGSVVTISKSTDVTGLAARYTFSQGGTTISPTVDIPADMVVSAGIVVDVVFVAADDSLHEGSASGADVTEEIKGSATASAADAGKYIKLTISNSAQSHLWIKATDLVDIYTPEANADEVQLDITNNVISAEIVDVDGTKITYIEADAGTSTPRESVTAALTRLDGSDSTTGSVAKKVKDAIDALDTVSDVGVASYTAGTSGSADVITLTGSVKEENGIIAAGTADTITLSTITSTQIDSLFS